MKKSMKKNFASIAFAKTVNLVFFVVMVLTSFYCFSSYDAENECSILRFLYASAVGVFCFITLLVSGGSFGGGEWTVNTFIVSFVGFLMSVLASQGYRLMLYFCIVSAVLLMWRSWIDPDA